MQSPTNSFLSLSWKFRFPESASSVAFVFYFESFSQLHRALSVVSHIARSLSLPLVSFCLLFAVNVCFFPKSSQTSKIVSRILLLTRTLIIVHDRDRRLRQYRKRCSSNLQFQTPFIGLVDLPKSSVFIWFIDLLSVCDFQEFWNTSKQVIRESYSAFRKYELIIVIMINLLLSIGKEVTSCDKSATVKVLDLKFSVVLTYVASVFGCFDDRYFIAIHWVEVSRGCNTDVLQQV